MKNFRVAAIRKLTAALAKVERGKKSRPSPGGIGVRIIFSRGAGSRDII